jgi:hypothetical protein
MRKVYVRGILVGTTDRKPSDLKRRKGFLKDDGNAFYFFKSVTL